MSDTRFDSPQAESPGFLLWQVTLAWQRDITAALKPLGLTHVQFVLLACSWWLGREGQDPNQQDPNQLDIAKQAGTDPKMTSEVLRKLEATGLILRTVDPADTRAKRVHVTEEGAKLARKAVKVVEDADAAFFGPASDDATALLQTVWAQRRDRSVGLADAGPTEA